MKTTIDIPDRLFRRVKARAAERGQSLEDFVAEALREKLSFTADEPAQPRWMRGFGELSRLRRATAQVQKIIDETW